MWKKMPDVACPICGVIMGPKGRYQHLASHGVTKDSDEHTIAAAIRVALKIKAHQRTFNA